MRITQISRIVCILAFISILLSGCGENEKAAPAPVTDRTTAKTLLFLGDSLTAGYGLDPSEAYPALIENKIHASSLPYNVSNAGISGSTSNDGLNRIEWHMESKPTLLVLALGANDGLRGIDPAVTKSNLKKIMQKAKERNSNIQILLVGVKAPPNMGLTYTRPFNSIFPDLSKELDVAFVPFLLEGVAAVPEMNLADGIHPNQKGQKIIAETVWKKLKPLLVSD